MEYMTLNYSWFLPKACAQKTNDGHDLLFTNLWCGGQIVILSFSIIICNLLGALIYWHYKAEINNGGFFRKSKTWLLISCLIYELTIIMRYTFSDLDDNLKEFLIVGDNVLQSYILFFTCYYFVQKGLKSIEKEEAKTIQTKLTALGFTIIGVFASMTVYELAVNHDVESASLCSTTMFLIPFAISTLVSTIFVFVGCKIKTAVNE